MNYCSVCGKRVRQLVPPGDHRLRFVCEECNTVHYENPRLIVGCLPVWEDQVLLCKRANEPRSGYWTLPAGFLETGETVEEGAQRETLEEAHADVDILRLFSVYSIPSIGQVYLFFLARLRNLDFSPGAETERTQLFREPEVPWNDIAFSSVRFSLEHYFRHRRTPSDRVYVGSYSPTVEAAR
jgi:ADP-ribose pyrophosphatase YjhB (NUDIX family)